MSDNIRVVALAFFRVTDRKYLICRRGPEESGAGSWEFPGGKIDMNETHLQALVREISEELSVTIDPRLLIFVSDHQHQYETKNIHLFLYLYKVESVEFTLIDHDQSAWVSLEQMSEYSLAAADIPFIEKLRLI
jgi:8-oxo-dGTP diphosphatase